jgi:hypothetical protein
MHETT